MGPSEHPRGRGRVLGNTTRSLPLLHKTAPGPVPALGHIQRHIGSASRKNYNKFTLNPQRQSLKNASKKNHLLNAQANFVSLLTSPSFYVCTPYPWPLSTSQGLSSDSAHPNLWHGDHAAFSLPFALTVPRLTLRVSISPSVKRET